MKRIVTLIAAVAVVGLAVPVLRGASDETPSVEEIVRRANYQSYYQGADGRAHVEMTIKDRSGAGATTRGRKFFILRRDKQGETPDPTFTGEQQFYVYFERPADVNKTVFMVHKHIGTDDDRWLYNPGLDLVNRIAATDKRTSFVGSHFYYEDVSGRNPELDNHELARTTDSYYVLKSTPKKPELVEFDHYVTYIHKATFIPIKTEYYDGQGKKYREYQVLKVEDIPRGSEAGEGETFKTVTKSRMTDLRTGGNTTLEYTKVEYNIGMPEEVFGERYLRNPPRKYLK